MSQSRRNRRSVRRSQAQAKRGIPGWAITGVVALATVAVVALIWLGQVDPNPERPQLATDANVKGDPNAPVEIVEWGDFQ